ncbi:MAG: CDP-alcohol phosphatidyltransferase family protein [Muribaculaceae bacterium]|nr:CDP-alcohol phosphatidyltransferase family protein [Muribaculaceae bacterium]
MGNENAERIQTSILNRAEKKALVWLAERQPAWVTSDFLSYVGVAGALLFALFCQLANGDVRYMWLASLGLVVNWYGDSLDGTLARVRNLQRPVYGFFIDHSLDALTTCMICIGVGLSPMMRLDIALVILAGYLCMSIYTYLSTIVMGKFRLTYGKLGPTEVRIIIILVSVLYIYNPWKDVAFEIAGQQWTVFDLIGCAVAVILFMIYILSMAADLRRLAKQDPAKPFKK